MPRFAYRALRAIGGEIVGEVVGATGFIAATLRGETVEPGGFPVYTSLAEAQEAVEKATSDYAAGLILHCPLNDALCRL